MYSLVACVFIAIAASGAAFLWQKPTVARGDVLAQDVGNMSIFSGATGMTCDDEVPITKTGAEFHCSSKNGFGDRQTIGCSLDKDGSLRCHVDDTVAAPRPDL